MSELVPNPVCQFYYGQEVLFFTKGATGLEEPREMTPLAGERVVLDRRRFFLNGWLTPSNWPVSPIPLSKMATDGKPDVVY